MTRLALRPERFQCAQDHFFDAHFFDALVMSRDSIDQPEKAGGVLRQIQLHPAAWMAGWFAGNELRGVIRASHSSPIHVEANLFVDQRWRRQGIGSILLKEGIDWARRQGASTLRCICDREDWPMRHLAGKFGARLDLVLGQVIIDFHLQQQ